MLCKCLKNFYFCQKIGVLWNKKYSNLWTQSYWASADTHWCCWLNCWVKFCKVHCACKIEWPVSIPQFYFPFFPPTFSVEESRVWSKETVAVLYPVAVMSLVDANCLVEATSSRNHELQGLNGGQAFSPGYNSLGKGGMPLWFNAHKYKPSFILT